MQLVVAGADITIVDDLSNSFEEVLQRMKKVLGDDFSRVTFKKVSGLSSSCPTMLIVCACRSACSCPTQVTRLLHASRLRPRAQLRT